VIVEESRMQVSIQEKIQRRLTSLERNMKMNRLYTRPVAQRRMDESYIRSVYWSTIGTQRYAKKAVRTFYKSARRLMLLSPYQARTYTFGRMVEAPIFTINKEQV
jgi:hypothetical protein